MEKTITTFQSSEFLFGTEVCRHQKNHYHKVAEDYAFFHETDDNASLYTFSVQPTHTKHGVLRTSDVGAKFPNDPANSNNASTKSLNDITTATLPDILPPPVRSALTLISGTAYAVHSYSLGLPAEKTEMKISSAFATSFHQKLSSDSRTPPRFVHWAVIVLPRLDIFAAVQCVGGFVSF